VAVGHAIVGGAVLWLVLASGAAAQLLAGVGVGDVTPPVGTPSAGYGDRLGRGMEGIHDRLLATALLLDTGTSKIALVGVDHLGFDHGMVEEVRRSVHSRAGLEDWEIHVGSSHTHAGGGAYLDVPLVGERLAGRFDPARRQLYVDGAVEAIVSAAGSLAPARLGIGYGSAPGLNAYRGDWPPNVEPSTDVAVVKVTGENGSPIAVLFNFAAHPTVLPGRENMLFSADFVGYARTHLRKLLGEGVLPVYFNGAQGDVSPRPPSGEEMFARCESMGRELARVVAGVWERTPTHPEVEIRSLVHAYELDVEATSAGLLIPGERRSTEIGLLAVDLDGRRHAFLTVPGELSTIYDADLERFARWLGYEQLSILGLTDDAHGYIITPESWRHRTYESTVSFGGELYGEEVESLAYALLHALEPAGALDSETAHPSELLATPEEPAAP
jgi:hypothetical protein